MSNADHQPSAVPSGKSPSPTTPSLSRRALLAAAGVAAPVGIFAGHVLAAGRSALVGPTDAEIHASLCGAAAADPPPAAGALKPIKLTWNANAICTAAVPSAVQNGVFARYGLAVELINFGGSTDQLLEAIATGKADAGVGMALRWLKPLEQGFDVRLTAGIHGGCMRLLAPQAAGIADIADLRGKTIATSDMASPDKNFFSIVLQKHGVDPTREVEWRQYPGDLLGLAVQKGEAQALVAGDPIAYLLRKNNDLVEVANNLSGEYQHRVCCVLGLCGSLIRGDRATAAALTQALLEAGEWTANNPDQAATVFSAYSKASVEDLSAMLRSHTHHHHPVGNELKSQVALYADELKLVSVMKQSTDSAKFADRIFADVLS
ncbi:MAG TPA: ABC transporter substrate-binding protein [Stellaceae bacterium]|nr:ABC transporter substrate-binding protein [Stellaceae bacterium]